MKTTQAIFSWAKQQLRRQVGFRLSVPMQLSQGQWHTTQPAKSRILIAGREHYVERKQEFAIGSYRDLLKSLKLMPSQSPLGSREFYAIQRTSETSHRVTFYSFSETLMHSGAWCILPESLLLQLGLAAHQATAAQLTRPDGKQLLMLNGQQGFVAALANPACADCQQLALREGEAPPHISAQLSYQQLINSGLLPALGKSYPGFWLGGQQRRPLPANHILAAASLLLACYIGLSSAWVGTHAWWVDQQLAAEKSGVAEVLQLQRQWRTAKDTHDQLLQALAPKTDTSLIWELIAQLMAKDPAFVLVNVAMAETAITIRGQAPESAAMLELIDAHSATHNTKFIGQVRKGRRGMESFAIQFQLQSSQTGEQP